jgi:hypothetical protein
VSREKVRVRKPGGGTLVFNLDELSSAPGPFALLKTGGRAENALFEVTKFFTNQVLPVFAYQAFFKMGNIGDEHRGHPSIYEGAFVKPLFFIKPNRDQLRLW